MDNILWDEIKNPYGVKNLICNCGCKKFTAKIRYGAGGSGTYFRFYCVDCNKFIEYDFDNLLYEG